MPRLDDIVGVISLTLCCYAALPSDTVKTSCGKPPKILHGELLTDMKECYPSGSWVTYKCPQLFKHLGPQYIKCQNGKWNKPPVCLEPCTTNEKNMTKNHIALVWSQSRKQLCVRNDQQKKYAAKCYVRHGDIIQFACRPRYKISDPEDLRVRCNKGILPYPTCFKRN
ncbi:complement factor H-related protein 2-like [Leptodactylus fuscus]|uniref:complement factor H-related protein 2-like n=1 Tax=Leptodactylus fuscus TaxID=238119 RepID=UPI003F4F1E4F